MRPFPFLALVVLTALAASSAHASKLRRENLQLQVEGLGFAPSGSLSAQGGAALSDLVGMGPGYALGATLGVRPSLAVGVRMLYFGASTQGTHTFVDEAAPGGVGPFPQERKLRVTTVYGLLQYRHALGERALWSLEAGGGAAQSRERLVLSGTATEQASAVGVQLDPTYALGAGLAWRAFGNTALTLDGRWIGTLTGDGAVWADGDSPRYLIASVGLRYPHDSN